MKKRKFTIKPLRDRGLDKLTRSETVAMQYIIFINNNYCSKMLSKTKRKFILEIITQQDTFRSVAPVTKRNSLYATYKELLKLMYED